ncbi:MAG: DUF2812 domain-containing protein [Erysipelotrichaceae bacterium]
MRKTVYRVFWAWQFEAEEAWLNHMAKQGWVLEEIALFSYRFKQTSQTFDIKLQLLPQRISHQKSQDYLCLLEESGAEYITSFGRWIYIKKLANSQPFTLYSDLESRSAHLKNILNILYVVIFIEGLALGSIIHSYETSQDIFSLFVMGFIVSFSIYVIVGIAKLQKKQKQLKQEATLYE